MGNIKYNTIYCYRLDDFGHNDKAVWLVGKWSYPRLETRYLNMFLPRKHLAIKGRELFIPSWAVDYFNTTNSRENYRYKYTFPTPRKRYKATDADWQKFIDLYGFEKTVKSNSRKYDDEHHI